MTTPHSILLVPAEGSTLLDDGPCGARPPIARRGNCCAHAEHRRWEPWEPCWRNCYMCQHPQEALVLAWAGAPCLEGIVWLWAKVPDMPGPGALEGSVVCALEGDRLTRAITNLGTILLLDEHGREITR